MSRLAGLAQQAIRRIFNRRQVGARKTLSPPLPPGLLIPPPVSSQEIRGRPSQRDANDVRQVQEFYDDIQLLGRDEGHAEGGIDAVMSKMRRVNSTNVWGYFYEIEPGVKNGGLLYVTFLASAPPKGDRPSSAGSTYVYFDVPRRKFDEFQSASDSSAGSAVWDYLRVRGSSWQHQHRYRLAQVSGEYIPRKATKAGFRTRTLASPERPKIPNETWSAISRLEKSSNANVRKYAQKMKTALMSERRIRRSTLPERTYLPNRARARNGRPNRAEPNRGN